MSRRKKVMVVGHEASLSGAPILLLNLFRLLIENGIVDVQFVIRRDGPLVKEYKKLAPVIVLKSQDYGRTKNVVLRLKNFILHKIRLCIVLFKAVFCDYFFFNTVVNGKLLRWLPYRRKPVVTYIHELQNVIDLYLKQKDADLPLSASNFFAYPSDVTKAVLKNNYQVPEHKLRKLFYYFPFSIEDFDSTIAFNKRREFRQKFDLAENDFVVGAMGTINERKGADLFVDVCGRTVAINSKIKFVWIGRFENSEYASEIKDIIQEKGLEKNLIFAGPLGHSLYNFSLFDIFFLSSREDTYPLVVLEAAMMKLPTICFSGSGGIIEFVGNDAGWTINGFSTISVANKILELRENEEIVRQYGACAFNKVISLHCNESLIIEQYNSITETMN